MNSFGRRATRSASTSAASRPYDTAHLGHAFCYVSFDVLSRFLRISAITVRYIQNITDIDNDILRRAKELGEPWDELGNRYVKIHQAALDALGVQPPSSTRARPKRSR